MTHLQTELPGRASESHRHLGWVTFGVRACGSNLYPVTALEARKPSALSNFSPCFCLSSQLCPAPAEVLQIGSRQKSLVSGEPPVLQRTRQIHQVNTWVYVIERSGRLQASFPRSYRFPMGGVEEASTLQTHNTSWSHFCDDPASIR